MLREMTGASGEFYSAQDADSEGAEGKFYVWSYEEVCEVLGEEKGQEYCEYFGITRQGNFEGKNIPNLLNGNVISDEFEHERKLLYAYRRERSRLHLDDKILTSWNALMIIAMAILYRVTGKERYLTSAERAQQFIEKNLTEQDGDRLFVSCRNGMHSVKGFLDDYAYYTAALISLYEASSDKRYLERAARMCRAAEEQFTDKKGGYFLYGTENGRLITMPKETYDGALPSGNSVMAYCLVRLSQLMDDEDQEWAEAADGGLGAQKWEQRAERQLSFLSAEAEQYPAGYCMFLTALLMYLHPPQKIVVVPGDELTAGTAGNFGAETDAEDKKKTVMSRLPLYADVKILDGPTKEYSLLNGRTTYYVCRDYKCLPPSNTI